MLVLIVGLGVSARLIFGGALDRNADVRDTGGLASARQTRFVRGIPSYSQPIETLRVGDRVIARNPEVSDAERASWVEPQWDEWLHLSLRLPLDHDEVTGEPEVLDIEIVRPESWFLDEVEILSEPREVNEPVTDGYVPAVPMAPLRNAYRYVLEERRRLANEGQGIVALTIDLNLPEMGAYGTAVVTEIAPCPSVRSGHGSVVTATFAHPPDVGVLNILFEGESTPIGVTENHPFWSVDRQEFLAIGDMELGENVMTFAGDPRRIRSKLARPDPEVVFNLEVYGEHVYFIGEQGILAHNSYGDFAAKINPKGKIDPGKVKYAYRLFREGKKAGDLSKYHRYMKGTLGIRGRKLASATRAAGLKKTKSTVHHILTNKNTTSTAAGGPYTPKFEQMAKKAGRTLDDSANQVAVLGHQGPHGAANRYAYNYMKARLKGKSGPAYTQAYDDALAALRRLSVKKGSRLNRMITGGV